MTIEQRIQSILGDKPIRFLQVGGFDGISRDKMHPLIMRNIEWQGIIVEPIPQYFKRLQQTYLGFDRVQLENIAIGFGGPTTMYYVDPFGGMPDWFEQTASFSFEHVKRHAEQFVDQPIHEIVVETQTVSSVIEAIDGPLDLLFVDAEGFDYEVVKQAPLDELQVVVFERVHLSESRLNAVSALLLSAAFTLYAYSCDIVAVKGE